MTAVPLAQVCSTCVHAAFNGGGVYCTEFHEQIHDERVAAECGQYEDDVPAKVLVPAGTSTDPFKDEIDTRPRGPELEANEFLQARARRQLETLAERTSTEVEPEEEPIEPIEPIPGVVSKFEEVRHLWSIQTKDDRPTLVPAGLSEEGYPTFTEDPPVAPPLPVQPRDGQTERVLTLQVSIPYYGREDQAGGLHKTMARICRLAFAKGWEITELSNQRRA